MIQIKPWLVGVGLTLVAGLLYSQASSLYCPQNHAYISVGMSRAEILSACGQPTSKEISHEPFSKKVPMLQLIYNNEGTATAFYGVWNLPVGVTAGSTLSIDVVDNKVYAVRLNGNNNKAFSVCGGAPIIVGDPVSRVYEACGNPSVINNTYITQQSGTAVYPEIWTYVIPYQPTLRLTFLNGKLESMQ